MGGTIVAGAVCATAASGANQPSCGYELAILSLAMSPDDCQASVAKTPTQNVIRNLIIGTSPPSGWIGASTPSACDLIKAGEEQLLGENWRTGERKPACTSRDLTSCPPPRHIPALSFQLANLVGELV